MRTTCWVGKATAASPQVQLVSADMWWLTEWLTVADFRVGACAIRAFAADDIAFSKPRQKLHVSIVFANRAVPSRWYRVYTGSRLTVRIGKKRGCFPIELCVLALGLAAWPGRCGLCARPATQTGRVGGCLGL